MVKNMYYMGTQNINEISAINNNTTNPDSTLNTTQIDLIKKLSSTGPDPYNVFKPVTENRMQNRDGQNSDNMSSGSYFFNEEELENYEENI